MGLAYLLFSCGLNESIFEGEPEDVASNFLEEYFRYQDYRKVKKYFHPMLVERIDEEEHENILAYEKIVMKGWTEYEISLQEKRSKGDAEVLVIFKVKGVRREVERERSGSITLMLDEDKWKVVVF